MKAHADPSPAFIFISDEVAPRAFPPLTLESTKGAARIGIVAALTQDTCNGTDTFSRSLADLALRGAPSMVAPSLVRCIIKYGQTLRALTEYNEVGSKT